MNEKWLRLLLLLVAVVAVPLLAHLVPSIVAETSLGVDLGTTYSVVAVCTAGVVSVIQARSARRPSAAA